MTAVEAHFYDGKSSQQHRVSISPELPHHLRVIGEEVDFSCNLAEVRQSSRVGNTPRRLYFPDGSQCETEANDAIDEMFSRVRPTPFGQLLHQWESRLRYALLALALTAFSLWAGVTYGIPALAKQVAFSLPATTDNMLGREALEGLDKILLEPTQLPPKRQAEVKALFSSMAKGLSGADNYRLEFRASKKIGANALALPSGIIVVTDPLMEIAKCDNELIAVFVHEIGHFRQRHALRWMLQNSATALVIVAVTGDFSSVASLSTALPALLVQSKYSRDFEREADDFAYAYLRNHAIPSESLTAILLRIEQQIGASDHIPNYLSSHPAMQERKERSRIKH